MRGFTGQRNKMPGMGVFVRMPTTHTALQQSPGESSGVVAIGPSGGAGTSRLNYDYSSGVGLPGQTTADPTQSPTPPPVYDCLGNPTILTGLIWTTATWGVGTGAGIILNIPTGTGPDNPSIYDFIGTSLFITATLCNPTLVSHIITANFTSLSYSWDGTRGNNLLVAMNDASGFDTYNMLFLYGSPIGRPITTGPQSQALSVAPLSLTTIQILINQSGTSTLNAVIDLTIV
jgi:hypothetical protein